MKKNDIQAKKEFPEGMVPLANARFNFACHSGVGCYTHCCRKLELHLYPYDIIRLKTRLAISSDEFLQRYVGVIKGTNPCFPALLLNMRDNPEKTCPFLGDKGCSVYEDRPSACRTYPLERAVERCSGGSRPREFYFMTDHSYCLGHKEKKEWTVKEWVRDQSIQYYNQMDDLWAEMDTLFADHTLWRGEGSAGPRQQLAFMVCYNVDLFRQYVDEHKLLKQFRLDNSRRKLIEADDNALLQFGFDWLKFVLAERPTLQPKR